MSDPQNILPEEAWNMIFNCVEDPQDILSCSQTCTLFLSCLLPTRTTWAFPAVFPLIFKHLSKNDVLRCRLVSRLWRTGADNFLQSDDFAPILVNQLRNHDYVFSNNFLTRISNLASRHLIIANLDREMQNWRIDENRDPFGGNQDDFLVEQGEDLDPEALNLIQIQMAEFISVFEDSHEKNPFPSRAAVLIVSQTNIESTLQFLNLFGVHIWSLGLVVELFVDEWESIQLIWKLLSRVPNLKHLFLDDLGDYACFGDNLNPVLQTPTKSELTELKWIELKIPDRAVVDILVDAFGSRSVTILGFPGGIRPGDIVSNGWKQLDLEQRPNLEWDLRTRSLEHLNLPLETINIRYSYCEDFKSIFDNLLKYKSTLRRLTLTFTELEKEDFVAMRKQVDSIYTSFLSQMKYLVKFNIVVQCNELSTEFRKFIDEILDANWIENYLEMGGLISGFRRYGYASITAGLKSTESGTCSLKPKYFTDGKHVRRMEVVKKKPNWLNKIRAYFT